MIDKWAHGPVGVALAKARPNDATLTTVRTGRPDQIDGQWPDDACSYCHYRPVAPPNTPADQRWFYGTGEGKHNPVVCACFRRYLAEGGDRTKDPGMASYLQACIYIRPPNDGPRQ